MIPSMFVSKYISRNISFPKHFRYSGLQKAYFSTPVAEAVDNVEVSDFVSDIPGSLTPREVVKYLDRYIIGQADAKKAVAIAFRNRWRRQHLPIDIRNEVIPKNILMIGPTGCGITNILQYITIIIY